MLDACRSSTPFSPAQKRLWLDGRHRALLFQVESRKRPRFTAPQSVGLVTIGACFSALGSYTRAGERSPMEPKTPQPEQKTPSHPRVLLAGLVHSVLADTKRSRTGNHQRRADQGIHAAASEAARRKDRHGRFRHRPCLVVLVAVVPLRQAQDRQDLSVWC